MRDIHCDLPGRGDLGVAAPVLRDRFGWNAKCVGSGMLNGEPGEAFGFGRFCIERRPFWQVACHFSPSLYAALCRREVRDGEFRHVINTKLMTNQRPLTCSRFETVPARRQN